MYYVCMTCHLHALPGVPMGNRSYYPSLPPVGQGVGHRTNACRHHVVPHTVCPEGTPKKDLPKPPGREKTSFVTAYERSRLSDLEKTDHCKFSGLFSHSKSKSRSQSPLSLSPVTNYRSTNIANIPHPLLGMGDFLHFRQTLCFANS